MWFIFWLASLFSKTKFNKYNVKFRIIAINKIFYLDGFNHYFLQIFNVKLNKWINLTTLKDVNYYKFKVVKQPNFSMDILIREIDNIKSDEEFYFNNVVYPNKKVKRNDEYYSKYI